MTHGLPEAIRYLQRWQNADASRLARELAEGIRGGGTLPEETILSLSTVKWQMPLSPELAENEGILRTMVGTGPDLIFRSFEVGVERRPALLIFVDNLTRKDEVISALENLAVRLRHERLPAEPDELTHYLEQQGLPTSQVTKHKTLGAVLMGIMSGDTYMLVDGLTTALGLSTRNWEHRPPQEPVAEPAIRGPKEGFTETLAVNLALLRRRLKDERLRVERLTLGSRSHTDVLVVYLAGLAIPELVTEVRRRLDRIQIDGVLESGYVEELIEDTPYTPFPLVKPTERPDVVAAGLLEGRVAIITDGTPHALVLPATFVGEMEAAEDYYERWPMASFVRVLRYLYLVIALLGPSVYIAITTYHHEMLPTTLLITLMSAREGVPFPALVEALLMELTLEVLREAGVRMPKPVGQAVSIVGALVIGEAAVRAGLVSPVMVIVVSVTAMSSFIIPIYSLALAVRLLRFGMMFLAGTLGFYGIVVGLLLLSVHMASLRSFGVPYLSPIMPPTAGDMKDLFIRPPWWMMRRRPTFIPAGDRVRQGENQPKPPAAGGEG